MARNSSRLVTLVGTLAIALAPVAVSAGNPHGDNPVARDKPGKGRGQGAMPRGSEAGPRNAAGSDRSDARGQGASAREREHWQRDWNADEFLAAGFTAAVLASLLGNDTAVLHTGAKPLPPGIAKNLARGKPLPPGIARQQPGGHLLAALPRVHGHEWYEVGRDLVLIQAGTLIVAEILREVFD